MSTDLLQTVISRLASSKAPVGYAALKKELVKKKTGVSEDLLRQALESGIHAQKIFHWGDHKRSKQCYWHVSREEHFDGEVIKLCTERALRRSDIPAALRARLQSLLREGRLQKFPAIGSEKERIGVSAESYAAALREFVTGKLKKAGIQPQALFGATPAAQSVVPMEDRILEALRKLEPKPNIPVGSVVLRNALQISDSDKKEFDRAVLNLRDQHRVYASPHDNPYGLPPEQRNELIDGGDGSFFAAVALRIDN